MHVDRLKDSILGVLNVLRDMETELIAQRFAIEMLRQNHPDSPLLPFDETIAAVKKLPTFIEYMDQRYAPLTADILNAIDQAALDQAFVELTRKLKPTDAAN